MIQILKSTYSISTCLPTTQSKEEQKHSGNVFLSTALTTHPSGKEKKNSKELQKRQKDREQERSNQGSTG